MESSSPVDGPPLEEGEERKAEEMEDSKREEEEEEANEEKPRPEEFKFLDLLKLQIRVDRSNEIHKEILNANCDFTVREAFRMFDQDNKGHVTAADLEQKVIELNISESAVPIILQRFDRDNDATLSYEEFRKMITPLNRVYQANEFPSYGGRNSRASSPGSLRARPDYAADVSSDPVYLKHRHESWEEDLKEYVETLTKAEEILLGLRTELQLDIE